VLATGPDRQLDARTAHCRPPVRSTLELSCRLSAGVLSYQGESGSSRSEKENNHREFLHGRHLGETCPRLRTWLHRASLRSALYAFPEMTSIG